jgi:ParB family chromosome partitioning protein
MRDLIFADPFRCRMWKGHERLEELISEETCREEIASVSSHGQLLPALGRTLKQDPTHHFELIYGARRLFIARHLNMKLLLEVRDISDREAIIALDIENRQRKDFSPYERGRAMSSWLRDGTFSSQDELSRALHISAAQLSRLIALSQLPTVLVEAFPSPVDIYETWGRDLLKLWRDPPARTSLIASARAIAKETPRPSAPAVYQRLIRPAGMKCFTVAPRHDQIVKDSSGSPLFRVSVRRKDVAFLLPAHLMSTTAIAEIKQQVAKVLQQERENMRRRSASSVSSSSMKHVARKALGDELLQAIDNR